MNEPNMLDPTPELPDDTPISNVEFPARIRNVLAAAGLKTVGEVREISDDTLLSFQDCGKGSVAPLRETLGLPSIDGVRPVGLEGEELRVAKLEELAEMAAKLLETARKLPPGQDRHNALQEVGRLRVRITGLERPDLRSAHRGLTVKK
jgi:DNA-directed RNA polymerase alpha subunit